MIVTNRKVYISVTILYYLCCINKIKEEIPKMKNYNQILEEINGLIETYKQVPVTKKVKPYTIQNALKRGPFVIPKKTPSQESEDKLILYQRILQGKQRSLDGLLKPTGTVKVDKDSLETLESIRERSYILSEEIIKRVEQKRVPKGYGHEVSYLKVAKELCEVSRKADEYLKEISPYKGKRVFLVDGEVITLKKILNKEGDGARHRKARIEDLKNAWTEFKGILKR